MSLLDKARKTPISRKQKTDYSKEELELVKAWLSGEIALTQVRKAIESKNGAGVYVFLAAGARVLYKSNNCNKETD